MRCGWQQGFEYISEKNNANSSLIIHFWEIVRFPEVLLYVGAVGGPCAKRQQVFLGCVPRVWLSEYSSWANMLEGFGRSEGLMGSLFGVFSPHSPAFQIIYRMTFASSCFDWAWPTAPPSPFVDDLVSAHSKWRARYFGSYIIAISSLYVANVGWKIRN